MNSEDQIKLLKQACEIATDWYGPDNLRLTPPAFISKWKSDSRWKAGYTAGEFVGKVLRDAIRSTQDVANQYQKRDNNIAALREALGMLTTLHGGMPIDVNDPVGMARSIHAHVTEVIDTRTKERDEALAKLAAKEKELADIYAAKPEPLMEYVAQGGTVQRRTLFWGVVATCESHDDAKRIADALNGGGK